jgi:hypothetical protein
MDKSPKLISITGDAHRFDPPDLPLALRRIAALNGRENSLAGLPFTGDDVTSGAENELQAVVSGTRERVDLPASILDSNYFANILRRARAGDTSARLADRLETFLRENRGQTWENSWVRFPRRNLAPASDAVFRHDLLADKRRPEGGLRRDSERFVLRCDGEEFLRVPVSYLLKLALADVPAAGEGLPDVVAETGRRLLTHFLNDNTSPETFSFHIVPLTAGASYGAPLASETARRNLLSQLLVDYANLRFGLEENGQKAMIYFSPQTPVRQRELNELIADGFYRELFMSPCLSGWDRGEKKHRYMELCHQVLSRSQLQGVAKLRESGIILNNLVVLPSVSNTSLANNGTHVSLGSRMLGAALSDPRSGFGAAEEKYAGDLAIKCVEHFLPLFVGTYSAAPQRLGFTDFHPEKVLGFLPHALDYTHLRMLWRRWRKKADISAFGRSMTPFGPVWLDRGVSALFRMHGDIVPDFRLVDYPAAVLSTRRSPALDGRPGNHERLKEDLTALGAFDSRMSIYLPYRQRQFGVMGFSGFEGRHYSLFENLGQDMGHAVALQTLVTAFAYRLMADGRLRHRQIPDDPSIESERRQIFFDAALGIPTFFVHRSSRNTFLRRILRRTQGVRPSRRYSGYLRVPLGEYRRALLGLLREEHDLVEALGVDDTLDDLQRRLEDPGRASAAGRLTRGILDQLGARDPLKVPARDFNVAAEKYYREELRSRHLMEAFEALSKDLEALAKSGPRDLLRAMEAILPGDAIAGFLRRACLEVLEGRADPSLLQRLIGLTLCAVEWDSRRATRDPVQGAKNASSPSIHRA